VGIEKKNTQEIDPSDGLAPVLARDAAEHRHLAAPTVGPDLAGIGARISQPQKLAWPSGGGRVEDGPTAQSDASQRIHFRGGWGLESMFFRPSNLPSIIYSQIIVAVF
jgi:hypothetical protein